MASAPHPPAPPAEPPASPAPVAPVATPSTPPQPPQPPQRPHAVVSPFGERIDEYHWLRDDHPRRKRPEVMAHLRAENTYCEAMLAPLAPLRRALRAELKARLVDDDDTPPQYHRGGWVWSAYAPGAEHPRLWRREGGPLRPRRRAPPRLLLDEAARAEGHDFYALGSWALSPCGGLLAWTEDTVGRRGHTLRVRCLRSGRELADVIAGTLEDIAWAGSKHLFYLRQDPQTLQSGPVYRHRLGTPAADDVCVFEEPDPTLFVGVGESASGRYVLIEVSGFDTTETLAIPARRPTAMPRVVLARRAGVRHDADHLDGHWWICSNEGAPDFCLHRAPQSAPDDRRRWRTVLPALPGVALEGFVPLHGAVAVQQRVEADPRVRLLRLHGAAPAPRGRGQRRGRRGPWRAPRRDALAALAGLGGGGAVSLTLDGADEPRAAHLRVNVGSMVLPDAVYDIELASGRALRRKLQPVPGYDAALYRTRRLWAPARDGARIPVTLAWRADRAAPDGRAPLLIRAYGAYGDAYDAAFNEHRVSLLDRGFVVAVAHVRGGADLGQAWYEAGRLMHKWNSFHDFVDATDALLREGWGDPARVFAAGGSAGGLLMGVVANEAGMKYRGMVLDVPFVDVLSTLLDASIPLTTNEWTQWGDPRDKAAHDYLLSYSPYDNLREQPYPAMLVTTGLWDAQVQYFEPAKYVARLRARRTDARPVLLHVNLAAGHGGASGRYEALDEVARECAFLIDLAGEQPQLLR